MNCSVGDDDDDDDDTFPEAFRSFLGHFQSLWTALDVSARMASPELVYINLETFDNGKERLKRGIWIHCLDYLVIKKVSALDMNIFKHI